MDENNHQSKPLDSQKARIRERYKGVDPERLVIIPADPAESLHESKRTKRVVVYARVSTDDPRQTSFYELQKNHYNDMVNQHPNWNLVEIYTDVGMSYGQKPKHAFSQPGTQVRSQHAYWHTYQVLAEMHPPGI